MPYSPVLDLSTLVWSIYLSVGGLTVAIVSIAIAYMRVVADVKRDRRNQAEEWRIYRQRQQENYDNLYAAAYNTAIYTKRIAEWRLPQMATSLRTNGHRVQNE